MEQYIPKTVVLTGIEKLFEKVGNSSGEYRNGAEHTLISIKDFLDTLEVKEVPIWEKVSPDTGQTTLYKDEDKSYLERFGYRIDLKELDKLPKKS